MWAVAVSEEGCRGEKDKERKTSSFPPQSNWVLHQPSRLANREPESITLSARRPRWRELHHPSWAGARFRKVITINCALLQIRLKWPMLTPPSLVYSWYSTTKWGVCVGGGRFPPYPLPLSSTTYSIKPLESHGKGSEPDGFCFIWCSPFPPIYLQTT